MQPLLSAGGIFVSDGTFGFSALELGTAVRYDLPIVVIIGNDAHWNAEVQLQTNNFGADADRTVACELLPTRYDLAATALGAHGELVEDPAQLTPATERALASGLPVCIKVAIEPAPEPSLLGTGGGGHRQARVDRGHRV